MTSRLGQLFPGIQAARTYDRSWLPHDVFAGVALTAFLVPVGMGYAQAAGLPPITGLYATIFPLLAYALFGPSRVMVLGPDSSLAAVIAAIVLPLAAGDPGRAVTLAAMVALLTGVAIAATGLMRLGFVTELLSRPVQLGYLTGIALLIVIGQTPKLLGFSAPGDSLPAQIGAFAAGLGAGKVNLPSLGIGAGAMVIIVALRKLAPRAPGSLVAVVVGILAVELLGLAGHGVKVLGPLPQGLPSFSLPRVEWAVIVELLPGAVGIALVAVADTTVLSQSLALQRGEEVEPNQELVALGAANVASGLFGGFAISSSSSRTPVAIAAGARTQLSNVVGAVVVALLILVAPNLLRSLPQPVLSGVVLVAAYGLVDFPAIRQLIRASRPEALLWLTGFLSVAFIGVLEGMFLTVVLSLGDFVRRAWRPHDAILGRAQGVEGYHDVTRFPTATTLPGLLLYRFDAPLFFANARYFRVRLRELALLTRPPVKWIIVAAEPVTDVDSTAVTVLADLVAELRARGVRLILAELKDPVKDRLRRFGAFDSIGAGAFYPTIESAIQAFIAETEADWDDADVVMVPPSERFDLGR